RYFFIMITHLLILIGGLLVLILAISRWNIHPFIALLLIGLLLGMSLGLGGEETISVLLKGFGETLRWIAVIIILGAFIGEVLQESGGAFRIADLIVNWVGERKLPWAMGFTGYIISIPVFVDVAYILLQPVTESLAAKSKRPVLYIGLALAAGLTVSHTLIPPTPGPLAVASILHVNLGRMLAINLFVALFAMGGGIFFVIRTMKHTWLESDPGLLTQASDEAESQNMLSVAQPPQRIIFDLLPILVPILLMGLGSFTTELPPTKGGAIFQFLSIPLVAILIGAGIALFQIRPQGRKTVANRLMEQAILKSALVIMITGAGGALGTVIKASPIQQDIVHIFAELPFWGMLLPFLLAAVLTTATGSITVSLVGSASMIGPLLESIPLSAEMVAALIGCGAFCVFHANASFFWLLNRLHNAPPDILYRSFSLQSLVMGISGLVGALLLILLGV
ncbi:MAG: GntP family permease, partial [Bacteroidota bacterium]